MKNEIYKMTSEEIQKKIEEYLPVRKAEKNKYGEVFTPVILIEEMLDTLPKEIWKNKDYKWLDTSNGIGNFQMIVYQKLNEGLKDEIKDEKERSEHIIKNMLYMIEINPRNIDISHKIFGIDANIFCGDFLNMDIEKITGIDNFDVIIGNPPYNEGNAGRSGKKGLDRDFLLKSMDIVKTNGLILFVMKTNWRSLTERKIREKMKSFSVISTKVFDFNSNPFYQNVLTNYFLLKKEPTKYLTHFIYQNKDEIVENKGYIHMENNIYFLNLLFLKTLLDFKNEFGDMSYITRKKSNNPNDLLISHRKPVVIYCKDISKESKDDEFYVVENPNKIISYFFIESNLFITMRKYGRFTGFATSKSLFLDIPNFHRVPKDREQEVLKTLKLLNKKKLI